MPDPVINQSPLPSPSPTPIPVSALIQDLIDNIKTDNSPKSEAVLAAIGVLSGLQAIHEYQEACEAC